MCCYETTHSDTMRYSVWSVCEMRNVFVWTVANLLPLHHLGLIHRSTLEVSIKFFINYSLNPLVTRVAIGIEHVNDYTLIRFEGKFYSRWRWRWCWLFWYQGMGGYNGADECGSCRSWKVQLSGKVFIKDEAQVASRVGGAERAVLYFGKLLFVSDEKKFGFRGVES